MSLNMARFENPFTGRTTLPHWDAHLLEPGSGILTCVMSDVSGWVDPRAKLIVLNKSSIVEQEG